MRNTQALFQGTHNLERKTQRLFIVMQYGTNYDKKKKKAQLGNKTIWSSTKETEFKKSFWEVLNWALYMKIFGWTWEN